MIDQNQLEEISRGYKLYQEASKDNFMLFVRGLNIPSAVGIKVLDEIMADFQKDCFEDLCPNLEALKRGEVPEKRRFWVERTKKGSKDTDMAMCAIWLIAFADRPFSIQVCAANRKQAGILKERIDSILFYNSWLEDYVEPFQGGYRSKSLPKNVILHIEATDGSGGAHGGLPDLLILNELTHVSKWRAMADHFANADGNPRGIVFVVTNAGIKGTPAHVWRLAALSGERRWGVHIWDSPSPWADPEAVEDARRRDPIGSEFKRLWQGIWTSGSGDALSEDEIDSCFVLSGPLERKEPGWWYLGGLDLGVSQDRAAVAVVGVNEKLGKIRVVRVKSWIPELENDRGKKEVNSEEVEREIENLNSIFNIQWFGYDPAAGGSFMAQRLRKKNILMKEMSFSNSTNLTDMATRFVQAAKERKLECYEDDNGDIRRDFGKFTIVPRVPTGYKLESLRDEFGHADVGTAIIITLPRAMEILEGYTRFGKEDSILTSNRVDDLTEEEIENLPDEFKDLFDMYDNMTDEFDRSHLN